jgi:hypothetical protein
MGQAGHPERHLERRQFFLMNADSFGKKNSLGNHFAEV